MDILYREGHASVGDVMNRMPDPPSYSAVRAMLRTLEDKGHVTHFEEGRSYIYQPSVKVDKARKGALSHLLTTFFDGSTEKAVAALLDMNGPRLSREELDRVSKLVDRAKAEGR